MSLLWRYRSIEPTKETRDAVRIASATGIIAAKPEDAAALLNVGFSRPSERDG
jgi:hypothetical protein